MSAVDVQDLKEVVIGHKVKKGLSSGVESGDKKPAGVVGIGGKLESGIARKLDDNEAKAPDTVGREVGRAIMAAHEVKDWDQKTLAQNMNITKTVVVHLEQGIHKKDNQLLQRLEKKLGIWLTGSSDRIGTVKAEKEKKKAVQTNSSTSKKVTTGINEDPDSMDNGPGDVCD